MGAVFFVMGSEAVGPMGTTLAPIAGREAAERFRQDHHGSQLLLAAELTPELLRQIAGKPPEKNKP